MYKVKTVTHYNKGQLVCELCFLQEIFNSFRIVAIGFPAYPLHFFDLASLACCLNVFEMNFLILAKIHNRTQEVEEAFIALE